LRKAPFSRSWRVSRFTRPLLNPFFAPFRVFRGSSSALPLPAAEVKMETAKHA
jgi:hypothetical protein